MTLRHTSYSGVILMDGSKRSSTITRRMRHPVTNRGVEVSGQPNPHSDVQTVGLRDCPSGGDPHGNGAAIVVRDWESQSQGEGRQVT